MLCFSNNSTQIVLYFVPMLITILIHIFLLKGAITAYRAVSRIKTTFIQMILFMPAQILFQYRLRLCDFPPNCLFSMLPFLLLFETVLLITIILYLLLSCIKPVFVSIMVNYLILNCLLCFILLFTG